MSLREQLLTPTKVTIKKVQILGRECRIRILPVQALLGYMALAQNDPEFGVVCKANAELITESIVNDESELVLTKSDVQALVEGYSHTDLQGAAEVIIAFNLPNSDEVEAASKN